MDEWEIHHGRPYTNNTNTTTNSVVASSVSLPKDAFVTRDEFVRYQAKMEAALGALRVQKDAVGAGGVAETREAPQEVVELNVGGTIFQTFRSTLVKFPDSMIAAMFSGRHPLARDKEGRPFLDRNPELFVYVLEYLRTNIYPEALLTEAQLPFFEHEISYFNLVKPLPDPSLTKLQCTRTLKVDQAERMLILCFDTDGDSLVTGNRDGTLQIWGLQQGVKMAQISAHQSSVTDVRMFVGTKSGKLFVVSSSTDMSLRMWDLRTLQLVRSFEGHVGAVNSLDLMASDSDVDDFPLLASGSSDKTVRLFNLQTGGCLRTFMAPEDPGVFTCVKADRGWIFGATGSRVLVFTRENGFSYCMRGSGLVQYFAVQEEDVIISYADCSLGIFRRGDEACVRTLQGHRTIISRFCVVGKLIVSGCHDGSILVWSIKSGECVRQVVNAHSAVVRGVKWANGVLYTVGADAKLNFWVMEELNMHWTAHSPELARSGRLRSPRALSSEI